MEVGYKLCKVLGNSNRHIMYKVCKICQVHLVLYILLTVSCFPKRYSDPFGGISTEHAHSEDSVYINTGDSSDSIPSSKEQPRVAGHKDIIVISETGEQFVFRAILYSDNTAAIFGEFVRVDPYEKRFYIHKDSCDYEESYLDSAEYISHETIREGECSNGKEYHWDRIQYKYP